MGRSPCCEKNGLKKGPWASEEDQKLIDYIQKHGYGNWRTLPKNAGLQRCGKSCRLRWTNYLRPDIKRGKFSFEEEETIIQLHSILGNKWSAISSRLPGRTDNEIKNYWNTHIRKRLLRMGIDPVTHSPLLDLLDLPSIWNSPFYNTSHQINLSRFMALQPSINPELLRLASSLFSSQRSKTPDFPTQNGVEQNLQVQNQFPSLLHPTQLQIQNPIHQENTTCNGFSTTCTTMNTSTTSVAPFSTSELQPVPRPDSNNSNNDNVEHLSSNFSNLISSQGCELNEWQSRQGIPPSINFVEDYAPFVQNYGYLGMDQQQPSILDASTTPSDNTTNSAFQSGNSNNYFGLQSVGFSTLSTPSSSPTPLQSNSTFTTEDERESYCSSSDVFKFEIPDLLYVNEFM